MRRRLLLTVLIATIAGLVTGTIIVQGDTRTCEEWQDEYAQVVEEGKGGVFAFVNQGPTAERLRELEEERPRDCPTP